MFSAPHHRSQVSQFRSPHQRRPPQVLAIPANALAPARGVVLGTLLSTALWATGIGLALRFLG